MSSGRYQVNKFEIWIKNDGICECSMEFVR